MSELEKTTLVAVVVNSALSVAVLVIVAILLQHTMDIHKKVEEHPAKSPA